MTKKVLVIDDDPDVSITLSLRLQSFGYEIESAKDGKEGLGKVKYFKPDLIFLDYFMPGQSGIEVLKQLKSDPEETIKNIPVMMLTGNEDAEKESLSNGAAGYITKPFDLFQLKEVLSKFFPK